ncbi:MAG: PepSY domain-containing protein [Planctomycetota bacterium]
MIDAKLKRVFWAWHFWAGIIVGPILVVMALTGAVYIFQPELELWWYADIAAGEFSISSLELDTVADRLREEYGEDYSLYGVELEESSGRAPAILMMSKDGNHSIRRFYFDPATQAIRGEIPDPNFFSLVLRIHRTLLAGTAGRIATELTTGWTICVTLLGVVLWWPRTWKSLKGVLIPRFNRKRYVWLRDLHSISGAVFSVLLLIVATTGLLYTFAWGRAFFVIGVASGQFDLIMSPPQSISEANAEPLPLDKVVAKIDEHSMPKARVSITLPQVETDAISIRSGSGWGPSVTRAIHLDRSTGEVLSDKRLSELPPLAIYTQWNYPLHVGSIGGITTKALWLVASVFFAMLPVAGFAMWWTRRKPGEAGLPNRVDAIHPRWLTILVALVGFALPVVGVSMALVWLGTLVRSRFGKHPLDVSPSR